MKLKAGLCLACISALFMVGCSPSPEQARQVLQQRIESQAKGHIKLTSFIKTDGQDVQFMGTKGYRLTYIAEVEFDQDGVWTTWAQNGYLGFEFSPGAQMAKTATMQLLGSVQGDEQVHRGQRIKISGVMDGTKSENGWIFSYGENHIAQ